MKLRVKNRGRFILIISVVLAGVGIGVFLLAKRTTPYYPAPTPQPGSSPSSQPRTNGKSHYEFTLTEEDVTTHTGLPNVLTGTATAGTFTAEVDELAGVIQVASKHIASSPSEKILAEDLLHMLPATAQWVWLGSDAAADGAAQGIAIPLPAGPYALYGPDVGLVLPRPDGEVEQILRALAPFLLGGSSPNTFAFQSTQYHGLTIWYANLENGQALDYAVTDTHLLAASSKEAMFALIDAATSQDVAANKPAWKNILAEHGPQPVDSRRWVGMFDAAWLAKTLPVSDSRATAAVFTFPANGGLFATLALQR